MKERLFFKWHQQVTKETFSHYHKPHFKYQHLTPLFLITDKTAGGGRRTLRRQLSVVKDNHFHPSQALSPLVSGEHRLTDSYIYDMYIHIHEYRLANMGMSYSCDPFALFFPRPYSQLLVADVPLSSQVVCQIHVPVQFLWSSPFPPLPLFLDELATATTTSTG